MFAFCVPALAAAQSIADGDTIKTDGVTYRLWGIDAPELHQSCPDGFPAGAAAAQQLAKMMRGHTVTCEQKDVDRYGRTIAICRANGVDLGAAMVREGWAFAFVRYSHAYVEQEREAKAAGAGLHTHDCVPPWEWRARPR